MARYKLAISTLVLVSPWVGVANDFEFLDRTRVLITVATVVVLVGVVVGLVPIALRLGRFALLRRELGLALDRLPIDKDTCLVGAGGGSFIAIGMLLKYWQDVKRSRPPSALCVALYFDAKKRAFLPALEQAGELVDQRRVLIVIATVGTGRMAADMVSWAEALPGVDEVAVFSLVISKEAAGSGDWSGAYTLGVLDRDEGGRSVIPWSRTTKQ